MESLPSSPNPSPPTTIEFKPADTPSPAVNPPPQVATKKCIHHTMNCIATQQAALLQQQQQMQQQQQFHRHLLLQHRATQYQPAFTLSNQPLTQNIPSNHGSSRQHGFLPTRCTSNGQSRLHPYNMPVRPNYPLSASAAYHQPLPVDAATSRSSAASIQPPPPVPVIPNTVSTTHSVDATMVAPTTPTATIMPSQMPAGGCPVAQLKSQVNSSAPITLDGPVQIQSQTGLVQPVNAALLADRYLLLEPLKGSSLYKCIDVRTYQDLVCKVSLNLRIRKLKNGE